MFYNTDVAKIYTIDNTEVKQALTETGDQDFKYLGSWCDQSRDITTRKALAWQSLNKLTKVQFSQEHQNEAVSCNRRDYSPLWVLNLDADTERGKEIRQHIYSNAPSCAQHQVG